MKTEDLSVEQMQVALKSFREWAKKVVIALGDEPKFDYDFDAVPGKVENLRRELSAAKLAASHDSDSSTEVPADASRRRSARVG